MMWAARPLKRLAGEGDKRTVRRFALWPTRVDEEEDPPVMVWLEWYYVYQEAFVGVYGGLGWHTLARYSGMPV
jgi:hypothetical protein